jgi:indole-3-glycerol phosphate synthase
VMNRLQEIIEHKRKEIEPLLGQTGELRRQALAREDFRSFRDALDLGPDQLALIAEVKRASPSAGQIAGIFDPVEIASAYQAAGAHAVSVLTDRKYFQGDLSHLRAVRAAIGLPVLRKDFVVHEAQIYEAACAGADAVLLIVAALSQEELVRLYDIARGVQLDVLVEVHTMEELDRALATDAQIIGINNRNLATFQVDLQTTEVLSEEVPDGLILVSESGIKSSDDTRRLVDWGVNAILVGETLMRSTDVEGTVRDLLSPGESRDGQGA